MDALEGILNHPFSREPQYAICCEILLGFDILLNFHQVKKLRTGKWRFTYWKKPSWGAKKNPWAHGEDMLPPNFPSPTWCPLGKLTWNLKRMVSKRNLLFQGSIFRFHVKFRGSIPKNMFFSLVFRAMDNIHLAQRMYRLTIFTVYTYHNSLLPYLTCYTVDGRNPAPVEVGSLSHFWTINSKTCYKVIPKGSMWLEYLPTFTIILGHSCR